MTKTIVIGENPNLNPNPKPIQFVQLLTESFRVSDRFGEVPSDYEYLELISKNYTTGYDLIFAYNDPAERNAGILFIGHWNDGVVE
jgi:hypothetical protein